MSEVNRSHSIVNSRTERATREYTRPSTCDSADPMLRKQSSTRANIATVLNSPFGTYLKRQVGSGKNGDRKDRHEQSTHQRARRKKLVSEFVWEWYVSPALDAFTEKLHSGAGLREKKKETRNEHS